jgi:hypothetical protein
MLGGLHALRAAFAIEAGPIADIRSMGMGLINAAPRLRNELMKIAMGDWEGLRGLEVGARGRTSPWPV